MANDPAELAKMRLHHKDLRAAALAEAWLRAHAPQRHP
jgi:hypothetical protein